VTDDVWLVEESDIRAAIAWSVEAQHLIVEGSGAVCIAALRACPDLLRAGQTVAIVTGGNLDVEELKRVLAGEASQRGHAG
jgi:threonine dehydratase